MLSKSQIYLFIILSLLTIQEYAARAFVPATDTVLVSKNDTVQEDSLATDSLTADTLISPDALEAEVTYKATDSIKFDMKTKKVYLYGKAEIYYKDIELKAAYIELSMDSNTVFAKGMKDSTGTLRGKPEFTEAGKSFKARTMKYNFKTKKGKITDVITQEGDGYIHGESVKKTDSDVLYIKHGKYTTCDKPHPHFHLFSNKLKVIPKDKVVTKFSYLVVEDVPTPLVLPFGIFPNKEGKASGIIVPEIGEDATLGFSLTKGGYYWAVNDYMDLQIMGDLYSKGSWRGELASQYKKRYKYNGGVNLSFFKKKIGFPESPDYQEKNEFFVRWKHQQDPKARPNSRFTADVNAGSRTNFNNNPSSTANDYLTNTFTSNISYNKRFANTPFNLNLNARHNQNTNTGKVNLSLPEAALTMNRIYPLKQKNKVGKDKWFEKIGMSYNLNAKNELDTYDSLVSVNNLDDMSGEFRHGIKHNAPVTTSFKVLKHLTVNPSLNFSSLNYFSSIRKRFDNQKDAMVTDTVENFTATLRYNANASVSTKIYGLFQFKKGFLKAIRHVATPQVGFSYVPENKQGIRTYTDTSGKEIEYSIYQNGMYGRPDARESGMINFGLINNLEAKVKSKNDTSSAFRKVKLLENLDARTSYDMIADSLNWSDIRISARTTLFEKVNLNYSQTLTPYKSNIEGKKIDKTYWETEGIIGRTTNARLALSFTLNNKTGNKKNKEAGEKIPGTVEMNLPWSISISQNLDYQRRHSFVEAEWVNTTRVNGNLRLTDKWKVEFQSGYDYTNDKLSYTQFNIERDLHCWVMRFQWVPFGPQKRYMFSLNVKSPTLQDLRIKRRRTATDVNNF